MADMTIDEIRARFRSFPEDVKAGVAEEVDAWRGNGSDLSLKMATAIASMSSQDLQEWMRAGLKKGDAAVMGKLMDAFEMLEAQKSMQDVTINVVPYTVADESVEDIILKGPDYLYPRWWEAMLERARVRGLEQYMELLENELEKAKQVFAGETRGTGVRTKKDASPRHPANV